VTWHQVMWHVCMLWEFTIDDPYWVIIHFLELLNYFSMEKYDMGWGDFLKFFELFFNGEMWSGMRWCGMLFEFSELFFNTNVMWHVMMWFSLFFRIIFQYRCDVTCDDVICYLNFQNYFSMEKGGVACGVFLEFLELFFSGERWRDIRWCGIIFEFSKIFFNEERWHGMRWCCILAC
jgi:hypothetical protein